MNRVFVNGVEGAGVPGDDPGLTRGLNVFETIRTYGEAPFRLQAHVTRLLGSAHNLQIPTPGGEQIAAEIAGLAGPDVVLRYMLTGGGNRVLTISPVDTARLGAPVRLARVTWSPDPNLPGSVKHGSRAGWVATCRRLDVDEILLVSAEGHLLECNRSNVFAAMGGELFTPPSDGRALDGITRSALLEAARDVDLIVREEPIPSAGPFDELYVTSTLKEIAPVVELDGESLPGWGPLGRRLREAFHALVTRECGGR